jgi:hypothetical protein
VTKNKSSLIGILIVMAIVILAFPATASAASDTIPPELSVSLSDGTLTVKATDDASGVAAVFVDGQRINALADGKASVNLKDYAGNTAKVTVYATDGAGNRSKAQEVDNPYYRSPASIPAQQATSAPASSASSPTAQAQTGTNEAAQAGGQNTASGRDADGSAQAGATPSGTGALAPSGTGTVIGSATDEDGKEFYTITTKAGNVFYLVIDRQRADGGVYFLNAVTESDLAALAETESGGISAGIFGEDTGNAGEPQEVDESNPEQGPEPEPAPDLEKKKKPLGTAALVLLAMAAACGAGYYIKIARPRRQKATEDEDEDWEDFFGEDEEYTEDGISLEDGETATENIIDDDSSDLMEESRE